MLSRIRKHVMTQILHTLRSPTRRTLHLAPPFLLDDHIPRYQMLSSVDASKKRSASYAHLENCNLCPRICGVNRYERTGTCLIPAQTVKVNVIAPHFGEGKSARTAMYCCMGCIQWGYLRTILKDSTTSYVIDTVYYVSMPLNKWKVLDCLSSRPSWLLWFLVPWEASLSLYV